MTEPTVKTCRRCGLRRTIRVWPWHCNCGMTYRNLTDRGTRRRLRGAGDLLAAVFTILRLRKRPRCKCRRRQETLNRWFPF